MSTMRHTLPMLPGNLIDKQDLIEWIQEVLEDNEDLIIYHLEELLKFLQNYDD